MLKIIGWVVGLIILAVVILFGIAAMRPNTFHVERSVSVSVPPEKVVPMISDFREWVKWSPWEKLDPGMKRTTSENPVGVGATYAWVGNSNVGSGSMEMASVAADKVVVNLHFTSPMEANNVATFAITPDGTGSKITWSMDGPAPIIARVMDLLFGFDKMIGPDFEKGLNALKTEAEKA